MHGTAVNCLDNLSSGFKNVEYCCQVFKYPVSGFEGSSADLIVFCSSSTTCEIRSLSQTVCISPSFDNRRGQIVFSLKIFHKIEHDQAIIDGRFQGWGEGKESGFRYGGNNMFRCTC
ncbi:hypothetical protein V6N13_114252 [Hibiscus sabdariffa]